jgi:hypothetical protein
VGRESENERERERARTRERERESENERERERGRERESLPSPLTYGSIRKKEIHICSVFLQRSPLCLEIMKLLFDFCLIKMGPVCMQESVLSTFD